jgi:hypothetical protein
MGLVVPNSQHLKPVCKGRQRYTRTDTSVTAQALRIVGAAGRGDDRRVRNPGAAVHPCDGHRAANVLRRLEMQME